MLVWPGTWTQQHLLASISGKCIRNRSIPWYNRSVQW